MFSCTRTIRLPRVRATTSQRTFTVIGLSSTAYSVDPFEEKTPMIELEFSIQVQDSDLFTAIVDYCSAVIITFTTRTQVYRKLTSRSF